MRSVKIVLDDEVIAGLAVVHPPRLVWSRREYQRRVNLRRAARDRVRRMAAALEKEGVSDGIKPR